MSSTHEASSSPTLFGHPVGLFTLFFAEMWERFSYYGMRALLVLYTAKGFLQLDDEKGYVVYGAYTSLVYATPFIGGMLADRLLGARKAVVIGGLLMAAGHLLMGVEQEAVFYAALGLLIAGNGFFKPNISSIVGRLYPTGSSRRDGGFTLFYMGINLGAAMAPLLCGYVGETWGWHRGFGLATAGMLTGLAVFTAPKHLAQTLVMVGALVTSVAMVVLPDNMYLRAVNLAVAIGLVIAAIVATFAIQRGGVPREIGQPPKPLGEVRWLGIRADLLIAIGTLLSIPIFALLVYQNKLVFWTLASFGIGAFAYLLVQTMLSGKVERERLYVVIFLTFFSMLFWSFFEQAGSSITNFTDRNVNRVISDGLVTESDVGTTRTLTLTQSQVGYPQDGRRFTLTDLERARKSGETKVEWTLTDEHVGMGLASEGSEIPASVFQSANPIFILIFGLVLTWLWSTLSVYGWEPSTPTKFALALLQIGLGFGALWIGANSADSRGMVGMSWLLLGYLLHTTGELCLSPVGLSMVTKLSPGRIVSTVMGIWFLATAFSNYLAGLIAKLTSVSAHEGGTVIPPPQDTVGVYGDVFGKIGLTAVICSAFCFVLVPLLKRWMHEGEDESV